MTAKEVEMKAIEQFGKTNQLFMVFEEMSELQKEICKMIRGKDNKEHLEEEMADVRVMLEQLALICDLDKDNIAKFYEFKIQRLEDRLNKKTE